MDTFYDEFKDEKFQALPYEKKKEIVGKWADITWADNDSYKNADAQLKAKIKHNLASKVIDFKVGDIGDRAKEFFTDGKAPTEVPPTQQELDKSQKKLDKIDEYIPDFAEDFLHGAAKNITDYTASGAKLFGADGLQKRARIASETLGKNIDNSYVGMAGEMIGDPLNLTPAGVFTKGTKAVRIAKSVAGGAAVGAGTMVAKNYGNDSQTFDQKADAVATSSEIVAGLNGIIAAVTKGRVVNAIKDVPSADEIQLDNIVKNHKAFGLTKEEATKASSATQEYLKTLHSAPNPVADNLMKNSDGFGLSGDKIVKDTPIKPPKVSDEFKIEEDVGFKAKPVYTPDYTQVPQHPPVAVDGVEPLKAFDEIQLDNIVKNHKDFGLTEEQAIQAAPKIQEYLKKAHDTLNQDMDGWNKLSEDIHGQPIVPDEFKKESIKPTSTVEPTKQPNFVSEDFNKNIPTSYDALQELKNRYAKVASNPRLQELLKMRENVSAKDAQSPQKNDFELTKQDISKLYHHQYDEDLLNKLETDLGTLDNHPDYAPIQKKELPLQQQKGDELNTNHENFKSWFKGSKVTSSDNTPKVVYHGTQSDFNTFKTSSDSGLAGDETDIIMFSDNPNISDNYTNMGIADIEGNIPPSNVMPVYLDIKNPKIFDDAKNQRYGKTGKLLKPKKNLSEVIYKAKKDGYDGVIIKNHQGVDTQVRNGFVSDDISDPKKIKDSTTYVVFKPNQIKSKFNSGKFDKTNSNILKANGLHSMAGGFAGGADSLINQRDYNGDGKYDYKDLLAGVVAGTISINALKKIAPKLFEDGVKNENKAGMFVGSKPNEMGTFSDVASKKAMKEIDDSGAKLKATPKELQKVKDIKNSKDLKDIIEQWKSGELTKPESIKLYRAKEDEILKTNIGTHKLGDVLEHKELFSKYPELTDTKVSFRGMPKKSQGYFDKKNNEIVLNKNMPQEQIKSTLLHEVQHHIQDKEGFATGGSTEAVGAENYTRLLGEQQARATQYRANMTPQEKASETWQDTLKRVEGEYKEPIVKFDDGGVSEMSPVKSKAQKEKRGIYNVQNNDKSSTNIYKDDEFADNVIKYENGKADYIDKNGKDKNGFGALHIDKHIGKDKDGWVSEEELLNIGNAIRNTKHKVSKNGARVYEYKNNEGARFRIIIGDKKDGERTISFFSNRKAGFGNNSQNYIYNQPIKEKRSVGKGNDSLTYNYSNPSDETIIPQKDENIKANGLHSMAGGFAGATDSIINQRDYNGDGKYDAEDLLEAVAAGAIGINVAKKIAPKLFEEEASKGVKIGAFAGDGFKEAKAKGYKHIRKIVSDESLKEWGDAASMFKRNWTDTLSAEYHKVREGVTSSTNGETIKLERLHNALKELSEADRTALHNYVAGESDTIDKGIEPLAKKIKQDIHSLSKELVERKVLGEEAFKEWEDHYIHRSYEKHFVNDVKSLLNKGFKIDEIYKRGKTEILSEKQAKEFQKSVKPEVLKRPLKNGGIRLKKLPNGKVEMRRDWTQAERESMGEITDGAITIPETLMRLKRMRDNAKMLEDVSKLDNVVLKDADKFTKEELDDMGYALAPKSAKYGVLSQKVIRKDVLNDIQGINEQIFNTFGKDGAMGRVWKSYLSTWKKSKTVWNVPSHVNNFMSNTFLMHLAGMNTLQIATAVGRAGKMMIHGNAYEALLKKKMLGTATKKNLQDLAQMGDDLKYFIEAKEGGLLGRSQLNDILAGQQNDLAGKGILSKADKFAQEAYHNGDAINRIAMYAHLREKIKLDPDEARAMVLAVMPDYSKPMPYGYRVLRDTGISPFISWSYYTMPTIYKMIKTKQGAIQATKAIGTLSLLEWALTGGEVTPLDNVPFMDTKKPENFKGRRFGVWASGDKITTIKTDRWIPYIELLNPINFVVGQIGGPSTKALVNLGTSLSKNGPVDTYTGRPITYKDGAGKVYDYMKYLTQSYVPLPAQAYTGWNIGESMLKDEKRRRTNKTTVPRTPLQEIEKFGGLNSLTYSKKGLKRDQYRDRDK